MNKTSYFQRFKEAVNRELREHRSSFLVYSLLRVLVIVVAFLQFSNQNYENVFLCILTLVLLIVPSIVQLTFRIEIPKTLEIIIYIFIFAAEILGEIGQCYLIFPHWDTMLHTLNGFLAAAIGFSMVTLLNDNEKLQFELSPLFMVLVSFSFSMTIGVLWELFEFGIDFFLGVDSQKDMIIHTIRSVSLSGNGTMSVIDNIHQVSVNGQILPVDGYLDIGLIDTMQDLLVNLFGAVIFSVFGFVFLMKKEKKTILNHFFLVKKR